MNRFARVSGVAMAGVPLFAGDAVPATARAVDDYHKRRNITRASTYPHDG